VEGPELVTHRTTDNNPVAILFVHGFSGDPTVTWGNFPKFLSEDKRLAHWDIYSLGYHTSLGLDVVGIWRANPNLTTLAGLLATRATVSPLQRYQNVALIAHSMGGLVVQRAVLDDHNLRGRVGQIVLFGTPSGGLVKASFFKFWKPQLNNMAKGGKFITDLRSAWNESFGKRSTFTLCVNAGDEDQFVTPDSSLEPFVPYPDVRRKVVRGDHLSIVKPQAATDIPVQIVIEALVGNAAPSGPAESARMAVETRQFQNAISTLEGHPETLDEAGLVQLALAYDSVGRREDAIRVLQTRKSSTDFTDAMGVLAGRLKRRWLVEHTAADADQACDLYGKGFELSEKAGRHDQAFYHGINVAFMQLAYRNQEAAAKETAAKVLVHCNQAKRDKWRLATEGEANLLLGNTEEALKSYQAAAQLNPSPRECDSMLQQAVRVASLTGNEAAAEGLEKIFRGGA
jgi:pimeloyl-ACP methyl ester carboxylesterase